eukprot:EG_transcript_33418
MGGANHGKLFASCLPSRCSGQWPMPRRTPSVAANLLGVGPLPLIDGSGDGAHSAWMPRGICVLSLCSLTRLGPLVDGLASDALGCCPPSPIAGRLSMSTHEAPQGRFYPIYP